MIKRTKEWWEKLIRRTEPEPGIEVGVGGTQEDSEDLTDEEVASAVPLPNPTGVFHLVLASKCVKCDAPMLPEAHQLRRRKPHLYWKIPLTCGAPEEHTKKTLVVRLDWIADCL